MSNPQDYRPAQGEIPTSPGVYRFSDARGRVLYVGKAKNLRARLSNYFAPLESLHQRTRRMVTTASNVTWTVVGSDSEALLLEHSWIKEFEPPFNVQFRDDKSYPYIAVTLAHEAPRAIITRTAKIRGAKYFGPYPKVWAVRETLNLLQSAFPIRTCNESDYKRAMSSGKPCLAGQIGRCHGPCSQQVTIEEHRAIVNRLVSFLGGNDRSYVRELTAQMSEAAAQQQYEEAAVLRDQIQSVQLVLAKSAVVLDDTVDADVFGLAGDELAASVHQFIVRGGRIRGERNWIVDLELDDSPATLIEAILQTAYDDEQPPRSILVAEMPPDPKVLADLLAQQHSIAAVDIRVPKRGDKAAVLDRARLNAVQHLMLYKTRRSVDLATRSEALATLQEALGLDEAPLRMECVDVSHLQGTNVVASLVVFEDGLPYKAGYRRYSIPTTTDDTDSIYQVISRRAAQLNAEARDDAGPGSFRNRPQLIVVDGGEPQVAAAHRALTEAGITDIGLCGIAKRLEEVWLPEDPFPVILPRNSDALFMIQRLRDEAHRFAITYQRSKRKRDISTQLSGIPGLGPARTKALLRHFGSVARLRQATPEEISEVNGIGPSLANAIIAVLGSSEDVAAKESEAASTNDEAPEPSNAIPVEQLTGQSAESDTSANLSDSETR
ncbi:excinuclease ABC subunit UvrC [Lysinibacter cavernae]|uniref:UvrABC system protein C n=1 Tax=Lysinibacter cavernae TaxID=1640652 RepID=A0A7X5TSU7_9MICO|nr:excinuclease ABC subunit UvrC [Lysinibacter cavernae]NIH52839.1 excinuclease ABC subunit C [Lysinibacter cavernae]